MSLILNPAAPPPHPILLAARGEKEARKRHVRRTTTARMSEAMSGLPTLRNRNLHVASLTRATQIYRRWRRSASAICCLKRTGKRFRALPLSPERVKGGYGGLTLSVIASDCCNPALQSLEAALYHTRKCAFCVAQCRSTCYQIFFRCFAGVWRLLGLRLASLLGFDLRFALRVFAPPGSDTFFCALFRPAFSLLIKTRTSFSQGYILAWVGSYFGMSGGGTPSLASSARVRSSSSAIHTGHRR